MTCWNGHLPHMNEDQMRQAVEAYERACAQRYEEFLARGRTLEWEQPRPRDASPPKPQSRTQLPAARPADKVNAIDVEFVRVR